MIDYELAKQLKEAGFPQHKEGAHPKDTFLANKPRGHEDFEVVFSPSLSELIEACVKLSPDGDFHLEHLMQGGGEDWGASTCWMPVAKSEWYHGPTPETAVATLWLALLAHTK